MQVDRQIIGFLEEAQKNLKTRRPDITLESVEKVIEFKLFVDHGELSAFGCGDGLTLACRRLWRHETAGIESTWH